MQSAVSQSVTVTLSVCEKNSRFSWRVMVQTYLFIASQAEQTNQSKSYVLPRWCVG